MFVLFEREFRFIKGFNKQNNKRTLREKQQEEKEDKEKNNKHECMYTLMYIYLCLHP